MSRVCASCPFRRRNQSKRVPKGWYSRANIARLWRGISAGTWLACTEKDEMRGEPRACAGALHLVVRHLEAAKENRYEQQAAKPLSEHGLACWRSRLVPQGTDSAAEEGVRLEPLDSHTDSDALGVPWDCAVTNTPLRRADTTLN